MPNFSRNMSQFQSTPPRGERQNSFSRGLERWCFNPRPRAGSDVNGRDNAIEFISFNPRPRAGSDGYPVDPVRLKNVSIHAPARGATPFSVTSHTKLLSFNPRPRAGSDCEVDDETKPDRVSIHAPARGATYSVLQPRIGFWFQSTPPRGERLSRPGA